MKKSVHRGFAWLLAMVMMFTAGAVVKLPAAAASSSGGNGTERVDAVEVAERTCYMYIPDSENVGLYTCTSPIIIVFGNENYTEATALETAAKSGLADIAREKGSCILFANAKSGTWTAADDEAVYTAALDLYSDSADSDYVDGVATVTDFATQAESKKYPGAASRIYIYGEGSGADFVAANYMKDVMTTMTFPDGFSMTTDNTPTSITLFNPTAMPDAAASEDVIAIAVVNGPQNAKEIVSALSHDAVDCAVETSAVTQGFDESLVKSLYAQVSGRYRRQVGEIFEIPDYKALGITETVKTVPTKSGTTEYYEYIPDDLDMSGEGNVPLVVAFHGGGNHAEFHAWASEWPLLGKSEGFVVLAVNQHVPQLTDDVIDLLNAVFEQYPAIDRTRVYATGFSMGSVKSWNLGTKYPEYFAGIMPMDAGYMTEDDTTLADLTVKDMLMPTFYVAGGASPLAELPHQQGEPNNCDEILSVILKMNQVTDSYTYDAAADQVWGLKPDSTYTKTNPSFKDCDLVVNEYASADGNVYTCLAVDTNKSHEVYAWDSYVAWDFISQFRRMEDGSIVIDKDAASHTSDNAAGAKAGSDAADGKAAAGDADGKDADQGTAATEGTETVDGQSQAGSQGDAGNQENNGTADSKSSAATDAANNAASSQSAGGSSTVTYVIIAIVVVAVIAAVAVYVTKKKKTK